MNLALTLTVAAAILMSTNVRAEDGNSYENYDSIVSELKKEANPRPTTPAQADAAWENVAIHGGLGFATCLMSLTAPNGVAGSGLLKGLEVDFGVNLFSRTARVEAAFRSFAPDELDSNMRADLKEFELSLVFLPEISDIDSLRMGFGLASRYLNIDTRQAGQWTNYQDSTPTSVLMLGLEHKLAKNVAIGPDVSYRSAMVQDTFDRASWDAAFRLNATF